MFNSINKTFGFCSKIFGCSNKKIVVPKFVAATKPFFFRAKVMLPLLPIALSTNVRIYMPSYRILSQIVDKSQRMCFYSRFCSHRITLYQNDHDENSVREITENPRLVMLPTELPEDKPSNMGNHVCTVNFESCFPYKEGFLYLSPSGRA